LNKDYIDETLHKMETCSLINVPESATISSKTAMSGL